jgi:putative ABC transport system ATP-binding protein
VAEAAAPIFALEGVYQERAGRAILSDLTLALPEGGLTALIGPSGAGKSSLLRLLNRLDDPTAGRIAFRGQPIASYPVRALRRRVGFVFQAPAMFTGTVADNLAIARDVRVRPRRAAPDERMLGALAAAELDASFAPRDAGELSGGERQRVSIARALMTEPEVLLLDEPTAALDPEVAEHLMTTLGKLCARGLTIVMVTHRLHEARVAAHTIVMLEAGRLIEAGPAADLLAHASEPRTREFIAAAD